MHKDLVNLVKLQQIDLRIHELKQSKKEFPVEVERLTAEINQAKGSVEAIDKKLEETAAEQKNIEERIANAKHSLERSQERLNSITTNREYDAVHTEIESQRQLVATGGNRLKGFSEDTEQLTAQKEEAQKEVERIQAENQPRIDELNARIASVDSDIADVVKERDALTPEIGRPTLRLYERVHRRRKNALAISLVSMGDGTCAICHKILEAQLVNEIHKGEKVQICESCGSLLIWKATEIEQEAPALAHEEEALKEQAPESGPAPEEPAGDEAPPEPEPPQE
ncbi:MAG: hypothetical protein GF418_00125 [Chitinivibrionales bacterium]|nr:hypothetical protein [Chitinivibrionales bacterium]MBD3394006.1 hypothetical protein [Chitinivibrionales bacterium]